MESVSIYESIKSALEKDGKITFGNDKLPDETDFLADSPFGYASGAFDALFSGSIKGIKQKVHVFKMLRVIRKFVKEPTSNNREAFYRILKDKNSIFYIQNVLETLRFSEQVIPNFLEEVRNMLLHSPDRNVVKYAIYFLGFGDVEQYRDTLLTLARHEEFTMHVVRMIRIGFKQSNDILFELAKLLDGWGKISVVSSLEPNSLEIRDWLLRYGCKNSILDGELAYICATNGRLAEALTQQAIDRELFTGAGIIITALLGICMPGQGINDYKDGSKVINLFLKNAEKMAETIDDLRFVLLIRDDLIDNDNEKWEERFKNDWDKNNIRDYIDACNRIVSMDKWIPMVWNSVKTSDPVVSWIGRSAAKMMEIDIWEYVFACLADNPLEDSYYFELAETTDINQFRKLVTFAEQNLPLVTIACGPKDELGLGLEFNANHCLDSLLQQLKSKDGIGVKLLETGLWSSVTRNRNILMHLKHGIRNTGVRKL